MREIKSTDIARLLGAIPGLSPVLLCPGLQGHGASLLDRSSSANHGVITGGSWKRPPRGLPGCPGVLVLGPSKYVTFAHATALSIGSGAGTLLLWVKIPVAAEDDPLLTKRSGGTRDYDYFLQTSALGRYQGSYNGTTTELSNTEIDAGWHMLACAIGNGLTAFWLDGESDGGGAQAAGTANTGDLFLGRNLANYLPSTAEVAFAMKYSSKLSGANVALIYNITRRWFVGG